MLSTVLAACCSATLYPSASDAYAFARSLARAGPRPAASRAERAAHVAVERRFRAAGLRIGHDRFSVPGRGTSQNVLGIRQGSSDCLQIFVAHADSVPPAPGANDNASGVGVIVALGDALAAVPSTRCDVWLAATGAEERPYTGAADHLGARALANRIRQRGRKRDVEFALALDEVGRGTSFWLRSPTPAPRDGAEKLVLVSARRAKVAVRWVRDASTGNSDHRELALIGVPAMKLGVREDRCRHTSCDRTARLQRGAFERILRVVAPLLD